jgi:hypothetical protein
VTRVEPRGTNAQKDEVVVARIGDSLSSSGGNDNDVAALDGSWSEALDLHLSPSADDHIALVHRKGVESRGDTGLDPGTRNRYPGIQLAVPALQNEAAFIREDFGTNSGLEDLGFHSREFNPNPKKSKHEKLGRGRQNGSFVLRAVRIRVDPIVI